jgi:hypothetical protein
VTGLWTSLEPASATVDPGSSTRVRLRLRNTGDVVDEYRFEPVGPVAPWTTVEPPTLRLYPGTTGTVDLTFAPPRTPDATAGPNPYAVRITPTEHPEATTVPEGNLTITPFTEIRAELVPPTVKGRFRGRPRLAVDNLGNTKLTASLNGSDNGDQLVYELRPSNVQIEPGRAAWIDTTLKPRRIIWFGGKERHPYTLNVLRSGTNPLPVDGTYLQRGLLPRWLATFLGIFLALTVTFATLWFAYKPNFGTKASDLTAAAGGAISPAPTMSLSPAAQSPAGQSEAPVAGQPAGGGQSQEADTGSGSGGGGSSGGDNSGSTKASPSKSTAPTTVEIIGFGSNRCIDVTGSSDGVGHDGTRLQLWDCEGTPNQRWRFMSDGTVRSLGLCMDVANADSADGTAIQVADCSGNPAQQFRLNSAHDLTNPQANKCVDATDQQTANGTKLQLWSCGGTSNQKWKKGS